MSELVPFQTLFAPARQAQFLEALALWGNVRAACKASSVSHQTVYRHRRNSRDFALAWDAALVVARPQVEEVLSDRALNGIEEVVFYHGEEIARRRRYDSRLLLAHLARLDKAEEREDVAEVAGDFDAALERLRRGEPVDPIAAEDDDDWRDEDDARPWENESLPFVERVLLYLASIEDDEADEGGADDSDEQPDPFAPTDDEDDDYEYEAEEDFDPSEYMLRDDPQDTVTCVTLQQDEGGLQDGGGADAAPAEPEAAAPAPESEPEPAPCKAASPGDTARAPRVWGPWKPIYDGRLLRY